MSLPSRLRGRSCFSHYPITQHVSQATASARQRAKVGRQVVGKPNQELTAATDEPHRHSRLPDSQMKIRHRLRNDGTHTDHSEATDCEVIANDASSADRGAFLHKSWQGVLV